MPTHIKLKTVYKTDLFYTRSVPQLIYPVDEF